MNFSLLKNFIESMNFNSKTINSNVKNIKGNNNIIVDNSINVNNKEKFLLTVI